MKSVYPPLTGQDVRALLMDGQLTQDRGVNGVDNIYGFGEIVELKAVNAAMTLHLGANLPPEKPTNLSISPS